MKWHATSGSITLPALGFIEPCIPSLAKKPPRGADWIFELKNDGYRLLVRKAGVDIRIYSRRGADFTSRFPSLVAAARRLLSRDPDVRLTLTDGIQVAKTPANIRSLARSHTQGAITTLAAILNKKDAPAAARVRPHRRCWIGAGENQISLCRGKMMDHCR